MQLARIVAREWYEYSFETPEKMVFFLCWLVTKELELVERRELINSVEFGAKKGSNEGQLLRGVPNYAINLQLVCTGQPALEVERKKSNLLPRDRWHLFPCYQSQNTHFLYDTPPPKL